MLTNQEVLGSRYSVVKELSEGGFGKTYIAKDLHTPSQRLCVIKQLKPMEDNPQIYQIVKERFEKEAQMLEDLGEGNQQIPKLHAYFEADGKFYLVEEWVEGNTLTNLVQKQGSLNETSVRDILLKLLDVLEYIQKKHIIHRDIKPDNIIIRQSDGMPILIDFGAVKATMGTTVAASISGNSPPSIVIGTPGFMPPEQSIGRPVYASDLYALGLTMIYLLTGKIPEQFETDPLTGELLWRQDAPHVSPQLAQILDQCIKTHVRDRFLTAVQMRQALQGSNSVILTTTMSAAPTGNGYQVPPQIQPPYNPPYQAPYHHPQQVHGQPVIHRVPIGQLIAIILGILGIFVAGGLGYFFIQQQQKLNAQIAELQADKQKQEEESQKEADKKAQEEQAKLQAEKEQLEARNKELEQKANQQPRERVVYITPSAPSRTSDTSSRQSSGLSYQYSCGSPAGSGSVWYAVVGSRGAYSSVKNNYCGDAFITQNGTLQVASFTSYGEAQQFAQQIGSATGYSFWVK